MDEGDKLAAARIWCADQFKKRYENREHPSFLVHKILEEAAQRFDLGCYDVQGWSDSIGKKGVQYLNYGDPYTPTLVALTNPFKARFYYAGGGWAPYARGGFT